MDSSKPPTSPTPETTLAPPSDLPTADSKPEASKPIVLRDAEGKFAKGSPGGPGRPKGTRNHVIALQRDLEIAVREHMGVARVKRVIDKAFELAESGNVHAIKLLLDKIISNAAAGAEESTESGRTVVFRIENATFAAKQENASPDTKPDDAIEAEFTHVPH